MQKYTPFTDDLQIAFGRCQARFKCAVAVVLVIALCAVCVTLWQIGRAKPLVLEESTKELLLKEASVDRKLKAWCDDVEAFADNIARQSLVQLSVSSYAAMSKEERSALNQKEGGYDEDKALMAYLRDMFATFAKSHDMEEGLLVMADGDILLGASRTPAFSEAWKGLLQRVLATQTFQYGSFHSTEGKAYINVGVPIFPAVDGEGAKPIGALIMALPLNSLFRDLLTPPADNRGIRRMALVQLERKEGGTLCIGVESRGNVFIVHRELLHRELVLKERILSEDQMQREDGQNYYVMFFPSKTGLDAHVCAMVPEGVMDQAIESRRYMTLVCLSVGIAFLALVLVLASLLRDRAVRALVNRRIAEQKAILDSINASIQDGMVLLDKVQWGEDGWPYVAGAQPSLKADMPVINR